MEIDDARRDLRAKARTVENAVMADVLLQIMDLQRFGDVGAQFLRRRGLADA